MAAKGCAAEGPGHQQGREAQKGELTLGPQREPAALL